MVAIELTKVFDPKELALAIKIAAVTPESFLSEYKPNEYQRYYNENSNEPFILPPMVFLFVKYLKNPEESEKCFNLVANKEQNQNDI